MGCTCTQTHVCTFVLMAVQFYEDSSVVPWKSRLMFLRICFFFLIYFKVDSLTVFLLFVFMVAKNRDVSCPH